MNRLAFHEALGVLGVGDLHPGGVEATEFLLGELAKENPRTVLEVGAGLGATTARMIQRGWRVVPLETSEVLRRQLQARLNVVALPDQLVAFGGLDRTFDAVIGESVFYGMSLPTAFERVHRLLRPGGLLALVDLVWTSAADPLRVASIHDRTKADFGIPVASRTFLTWRDWRRVLADSGFEALAERKVPPGPSRSDEGRRSKILWAAAGHPVAFLRHLGYRRRYRDSAIPPGWTESWMSVWRRV